MLTMHGLHRCPLVRRYIDRHQFVILAFHRDLERAAANFTIRRELLAAHAGVDLKVARASTKGALYCLCFKHAFNLVFLLGMQKSGFWSR